MKLRRSTLGIMLVIGIVLGVILPDRWVATLFVALLIVVLYYLYKTDRTRRGR